MNPKVGIIGDGNVGSALRQGLTRAGYDVRTSGREPEDVQASATYGDVVVLAVPFDAREDALQKAGQALNGKVLVDVTNAVGPPDYDTLEVEPTRESGAEQLQRRFPMARVVKAFNTVFAGTMSTGKVKGEKLTLFVAGDDAAAKDVVTRMGRDVGFDPIDAGPLRQARWMEALGYFNMQLGQRQGREMGFKLVH